MSKKKNEDVNVEEYNDSVDESFKEVSPADAGLDVAVVPDEPKIVKKSRAELKNEAILKAVEEGNAVIKSVRQIKTSGEMVLEGAYSKIEKYISSLNRGYSTGLVVLGQAGLGKSFTVENVLKDKNMDFESIEAYITPPELFLALWRCRRKGKVLKLDDCYGVVENPRCLSYLKSALASTQQRNANRVITNGTQKPLQDPISGIYIPNSFVFEGTVIIITNTLPSKGEHIKAVLSRCDFVTLEFTDVQKFKIMDEIIKKPYDDTSVDERRYCLEYLMENSKMCPKYKLNFRTLKKLFEYYLFNKDVTSGVLDKSSFDIMARGLLELDNDGIDDADIVCAKELETHGELNREEKCEQFMKLQDKSRATYFRVLDRAGINHKVKKADGMIEPSTELIEVPYVDE